MHGAIDPDRQIPITNATHEALDSIYGDMFTEYMNEVRKLVLNQTPMGSMPLPAMTLFAKMDPSNKGPATFVDF